MFIAQRLDWGFNPIKSIIFRFFLMFFHWYMLVSPRKSLNQRPINMIGMWKISVVTMVFFISSSCFKFVFEFNQK